jgi:hypothetical protein
MKKIIVSIVLFCSCMKQDAGHHCRWSSCPYKGIKAGQYSKAVTDYVGETYTDGWCIDMLHLNHPEEEYEQLEQRLFQ